MTKSPQGVYVNEATHNRVSMLVENALDGHGTLAGFVAFLEGAVQDVANEVRNNAQRFDGGGDALREWGKAPKDGLEEPPSRRAYESAWRRLRAALPWGKEDPRQHVLPLFLLSRDDRLWVHDVAFDAPLAESYLFVDTGTVLADMLRLAHGDEPQFIKGTRMTGAPSAYEVASAVLWKGAAVELVLDEVKSRSTSFYLDEEAHRLAVGVFGRGLFDRLERGLKRLLDDPHHWLPWEAEFHFLEHGPDLVTYQAPRLNASEGEELKADLARGVRIFDAADTSDPLVQRHAFPFSWELSRLDPFGLPTGERLGTAHNTLVLGYRLGLVTLGEDADAEQLKRNLLPAFLERFGLQALGPERRLAYQVIRALPKIPKRYESVNNALDYHLLQLFQAYALSVLPEEQREERRVELHTLATLSQPWVFPTKATLEAFGNAKASKTATGAWEITGGRQASLKLSDAEAYWTAKALNSVVTNQPSQTLTPTVSARWDDPDHEQYDAQLYGPDVAQAWAATLSEFTSKPRLTLPLGLDTLRAAHDAVLRTGQPPAPLLAGMKLYATITDQALDARGEFSKAFLKRLAYDELVERGPLK